MRTLFTVLQPGFVLVACAHGNWLAMTITIGVR
jgi:hypothetical protein